MVDRPAGLIKIARGRKKLKPDLIIFDCDGVLVDSEAIASQVIAQDLTALGWKMTPEESLKRFLGMNITDMQPIIEAHLGQTLPKSWPKELAARVMEAMKTKTRLMPGAEQVLKKVTEMDLDWRIASNSSDAEMQVKFACTGLTALVEGRYISASRVIAKGGKAKPAPDIYLEAAREAGVAPARCLVVEDSPLGARAAVAAGMACYGLDPHGEGEALRAEGVKGIFHRLDEIFGVIA